MKHAILATAALFGAIAVSQIFAPGGLAQTGSAQAKPAQTAAAQPKPAAPLLTGFPFTNESLAYTVNWPSGLSLGEGHLSATSEPSGWRFELSLDAGIPGFEVKDTFRGASSTEFCSASFSKDSVHGPRKTNETVTIEKPSSDKAGGTATRPSNYGGTGGTSKIAVPGCVRDALTFLFYARRELGQGRVPPAQQIVFGGLYTISLDYAGAETVTVADKRILTDKIVCHVKGPASNTEFDAYFDRDPARTPVAIRVPLAMGKFSLELVR